MVALVLAARPGTTVATYSRRAVVIVLVVIVATLAVAIGLAVRQRHLDRGSSVGIAIAGSLAAGVVALFGVLPIVSVRPAPPGSTERQGLRWSCSSPPRLSVRARPAHPVGRRRLRT